MIQLKKGNCLDLLPEIDDDSVDLLIADLPFGTTHNGWDRVIPMSSLWPILLAKCKQNAAMLFFSQQPFATDLICSNRKIFRYEIIYEKSIPQGFLNANRMPPRAHENILIFYEKLPKFHPQKYKVNDKIRLRKRSMYPSSSYGPFKENTCVDDGMRLFTDVIGFSNFNGTLFGKETERSSNHPCAKPIPLYEYLIQSYSDVGDLVLDPTFGSGNSAIAARNTGRNYIGIEKDEKYFLSAKRKIEDMEKEVKQMDFLHQ